MEQPKVGPKGELSGSEHMPAGAGWVACRRQPVGRDERERTRQPERSVEHPRDSALILGESQQCSPGGASEATSQYRFTGFSGMGICQLAEDKEEIQQS